MRVESKAGIVEVSFCWHRCTSGGDRQRRDLTIDRNLSKSNDECEQLEAEILSAEEGTTPPFCHFFP